MKAAWWCAEHRGCVQVVQECVEHKNPDKLSKHLRSINAACDGARTQPQVPVVYDEVKVCPLLAALHADLLWWHYTPNGLCCKAAGMHYVRCGT
jgi:hypothetical protein